MHLKNYKVGSSIGEGTFGKVREAIHLKKGLYSKLIHSTKMEWK